MRSVLSLIVVALFSGSTAGLAQHWPHWRGPTHDGVSTEKGLPDTWSAVCAATAFEDAEAPGGPFDSPDIATRYFFIHEWARAAGGCVFVVLVARPEMIDPQKFGVTVAANAGLTSEVFDSEEEARAWLQGQVRT